MTESDFQKLVAIMKSVRAEFPNAELSLDLCEDQTTIQIRQSDYDKDITERIAGLWDKHDKELASIEQFILITTDFQRPKGAGE